MWTKSTTAAAVVARGMVVMMRRDKELAKERGAGKKGEVWKNLGRLLFTRMKKKA